MTDTETMTRRQRRRSLTDKMVQALPRKAKRYPVSDPEQRGHYLRVPPRGPIVFAAVARNPYGDQVWTRIGTTDDMTIEEAREEARKRRKRIEAGLPPVEPRPIVPESFQAVAESWLKRYVAKQGLITQPEIERVLRVYVYPFWGSRPFTEIRRSDVAKLLDHIEDERGARTADVVLTVLRSIGKWFGSRSDDYLSPFREHVRRDKGGKRDRILDDAELASVWKAAEGAGTFGALVRTLLTTAQRLGKVEGMHFDNIDAEGVWHIPSSGPREKNHAGTLQLPKLALDVIRAQPRISGNPFVFPAPRGDRFYHDAGSAKARLDKASGVTGWTLHDCRRTARSLMSRAGVSSEHAERVMGHVIGGVEGVYDRHRYTTEKGVALAKLAALIEQIVHGEPGENVVPFRAPATAPQA